MTNRIITAFLALILSACATPQNMAFHDDSENLAEKKNPIFLMTATLKNNYKKTFQPSLLVAHIEKPDAKDASDRINFKMDEKAKNETDSPETGNQYFLRLELPIGKYEIIGLTSIARFFPIQGFFFTPIHSTLEAKEPGIFYLGHVNAVVRERTEGEFKAGGSIPLIDQAVIGASGGTFDVEIKDDWLTDENMFITRFPALKGATVQKAILPDFDRAKAQQWWKSH